MSRFLQFFLKGAWPRAWLRLTLAAGAAIGVPFIRVYPVLRKILIKFPGPSRVAPLKGEAPTYGKETSSYPLQG